MKALPLSVSCLLTPLLALAGEVSITLPPETGVYKAAPGVELASANCLMCHSTEYVSSQPPMPRKFWEDSVKKMKAKFGAPIPDADFSGLVDYLTKTYGASDK